MEFKSNIINDFLEKYDYWALVSKKWLSKSIEDRNKKLDKFLSKFPESTIRTLDIDNYVVGRGTNNSFCWWVETNLCDLGDIRPRRLNAFQKFGLYYDNKKKDYSFGSKVTKNTKFGSNYNEIYKNVRSEIASLISDVRSNNYAGIASNKLNPLFKNKITFLYDSTHWLPIYSDADLNVLLSLLEIPFDINADRVYKRVLLYEFYKALNRPDITTLSFMDFIYNDLGYRPPYLRVEDADKLNQKTIGRKFRLVEVKSIEELVPKSKGSKHGLVSEKQETLAQKKITGKKGEEIIKEYLNSHKTELGIVGDIECACEVDDSKHYDFSFRKADGTIMYIESKATKANRNQTIVFEMSDDEYNFMKQNKNNYFIYFINDVFNGDLIKSISAKLIVGKPIKYRVSVIDNTN